MIQEYGQIVNPQTNREVSIFSNLGKQILSNYIQQHQNGGYVKHRDNNESELEHIFSHGGSSTETSSVSDGSLFSEIPAYQGGGEDEGSDNYSSKEYIRAGVRVLSPKAHRDYTQTGISTTQGGGAGKLEWKSAKQIENKTDFINMVNSTSDKLLMVYAPWCGHCVNTKPLLDMVSANNKDNEKEYYVMDGDTPAVKDILEQNDFNISGYPTFKKMLRKDNNHLSDYTESRNEYDLTHFNE